MQLRLCSSFLGLMEMSKGSCDVLLRSLNHNPLRALQIASQQCLATERVLLISLPATRFRIISRYAARDWRATKGPFCDTWSINICDLAMLQRAACINTREIWALRRPDTQNERGLSQY